jgi:hypothetical protein
MANTLPPPKMPPLPGLGGNTQPKMPPPEVQNAINLASMATHANGLLALLALEELSRLRAELKLPPLNLEAAAAALEDLPPEFEKQVQPAAHGQPEARLTPPRTRPSGGCRMVSRATFLRPSGLLRPPSQ